MAKDRARYGHFRPHMPKDGAKKGEKPQSQVCGRLAKILTRRERYKPVCRRGEPVGISVGQNQMISPGVGGWRSGVWTAAGSDGMIVTLGFFAMVRALP
jgi:hypothetical protein